MIKKRNKRMLSIFVATCLISLAMSFAAMASPRVTTQVVIKNIETGDITEWPLNDIVTREVIDENGQLVNVSTVTFDGSSMQTNARAGQSNYNVISGWKGTVSITYTDDGTYACLKSASGSWERQSGSSTISDKKLTYGQDLGTNSRSGSTSMPNSSTSVRLVWPAGKYGYNSGHKVGANVSGKIGSNYVYVYCNVSF